MQEALLLPADRDDPSSVNYVVLPTSLSTLNETTFRALPITSPLSPLLFHSPFASLTKVRAIIDLIFTLALNGAIGYGIGCLEWKLQYAANPVPVFNPFAQLDGHWNRGSLAIDLQVTLILTTLIINTLQGSILQLEVSRALRRPIHPHSLSVRPFSLFPALLYPHMLRRTGRLLLQFTLPCMVATMVYCMILCAVAGGGLGACGLSTETTLWLKVLWTVVFLIPFYPLLVVNSINSVTLTDKRLNGYLDRVRAKAAAGEEPQPSLR
jgi:hypothetical protein